jgi:adenylate cyclase
VSSEIERKFLVRELPAEIERRPPTDIRQGYVAIEPDGTEVRVRRRGDRAELTVKRGSGRTRAEHEVELDDDAFARLWPLTEGRRIEKTRYVLPLDPGLTLELDVYAGGLAGLATAEVEFASEADADAFDPPEWLGREVTDDPRYKNQSLATAGLPDAPAESSIVASVATTGSAAVAGSAATASSVAVAASAGTAGSVGVALSAASAGSVAVAASAATAVSAGVLGSLLTVFGAAIGGCVATLGCVGCVGCVGCAGCIDCVDCVGCVGCVGLRGGVGEVLVRGRGHPARAAVSATLRRLVRKA